MSCSDGRALEFDSRVGQLFIRTVIRPLPRCLVFIRTPLIYRDQARRPKTSIFIRFSSGISPKLAKFYPHREEASGRIFGGPTASLCMKLAHLHRKQYYTLPPLPHPRMAITTRHPTHADSTALSPALYPTVTHRLCDDGCGIFNTNLRLPVSV